jgi:hypothetical protein
VAQLKLDFSPKGIPADFGKKVERIPISCSAEFKTIFHKFVELTRSESDSALGFRYLVEGMQNDLDTVFIKNPDILNFLKEHFIK